MNWDQVSGQWQQFTGEVKSKWAKLTDDDVKAVGGKRDVLIGKLQQHYGVLKDEAEKQVDTWIAKLSPSNAQKQADRSAR
jgi:uncharacterized protein YjbJ (UPF0337 family)